MTANYLNSTELGRLLGMTPNAVKLARIRACKGAATWKLFTPDVIVGAGGSVRFGTGREGAWVIARPPVGLDVWRARPSSRQPRSGGNG